MRRPMFTHEMRENAQEFESIYLADKHGWTELFPHQIWALLELKSQVKMMCDEGNECAFTDLVGQAQDLENEFKKCVLALGLSVKS